jgi:hypothetical protein
MKFSKRKRSCGIQLVWKRRACEFLWASAFKADSPTCTPKGVKMYEVMEHGSIGSRLQTCTYRIVLHLLVLSKINSRQIVKYSFFVLKYKQIVFFYTCITTSDAHQTILLNLGILHLSDIIRTLKNIKFKTLMLCAANCDDVVLRVPVLFSN